MIQALSVAPAAPSHLMNYITFLEPVVAGSLNPDLSFIDNQLDTFNQINNIDFMQFELHNNQNYANNNNYIWGKCNKAFNSPSIKCKYKR